MNDGWDLDVGDLVAVRKGQRLGGTIGVITQIIVPREQFFVHWLTDEYLGTMCMYTYIKPLGGDNENR